MAIQLQNIFVELYKVFDYNGNLPLKGKILTWLSATDCIALGEVVLLADEDTIKPATDLSIVLSK
jgi:hypothetical protein